MQISGFKNYQIGEATNGVAIAGAPIKPVVKGAATRCPDLRIGVAVNAGAAIKLGAAITFEVTTLVAIGAAPNRPACALATAITKITANTCKIFD